jgi:hypothetical protein
LNFQCFLCLYILYCGLLTILKYLNLLFILVNEGLDLLGMDGLKVKHLLFEDLLEHGLGLVLEGLKLKLMVGKGSLSLRIMLGHEFF